MIPCSSHVQYSEDISDNSYITQEPIESIPSEPIKSGWPYITKEHIETEAQNVSISQNLARGSETSNNVNLISQIDASNLTEHIDDIRQDFDETPQIDPLLNISTPNISINSSPDEPQNNSNEVIGGDLEKLSSLKNKKLQKPLHILFKY